MVIGVAVMIPRNPHVGQNSTTLDASFGDPTADRPGRRHPNRHVPRDPAPTRGGRTPPAVVPGSPTSTPATAAAIDWALQRCGRCVTLNPCRAEAIADPRLDHGIRGGMDVAARKNARRNHMSTKES